MENTATVVKTNYSYLPVDSVNVYLNSIAGYAPVMPKEELNKLFKRMEEHPEESKEITNKIIEGNMRLVINIAKNTKIVQVTQSYTFDDICQCGMIGLFNAIKYYDYKLGYSFATYAGHWIIQSIRRETLNFDSMIRVPVHINEKMYFVRNIYKKKKEELGRNPILTEYLPEIKKKYPAITESEINEFNNMYSLFSLDVPIDTEDNDATLGSFITAKEHTEDAAIGKHTSDWLWEKIKSFVTDREYFILQKRMGYDGEYPMTLAEIGEELEISRERVRQIEQMALRKIKIKLKKENIICKNDIL